MVSPSRGASSAVVGGLRRPRRSALPWSVPSVRVVVLLACVVLLVSIVLVRVVLLVSVWR